MALGRHRVHFVLATPRARSQGGWWPDTLPSEGEPARYGDRREAVAGGAVAEPAASPTVGSAAGRHAARRAEARAHGGKREPARDGDRGGATGGRTVAEQIGRASCRERGEVRGGADAGQTITG